MPAPEVGDDDAAWLAAEPDAEVWVPDMEPDCDGIEFDDEPVIEDIIEVIEDAPLALQAGKTEAVSAHERIPQVFWGAHIEEEPWVICDDASEEEPVAWAEADEPDAARPTQLVEAPCWTLTCVKEIER